MSQVIAQKSFNSGEWAPALRARVDVERYHSAAALIQNFFVDYRGGVSTRPGSKFIVQCHDSTDIIRLIPFQASFDLGYALEFGDRYIRFMYNGAPILETGISITGLTQANPGVIVATTSFAVGDMVIIPSAPGMPQIQNRYFTVRTNDGFNLTLFDMYGNVLNTSTYGTYTGGAVIRRVYKLSSPYEDTDLALLKFVQNTSSMIICHPSYTPHILTIQSAASWLLSPVVFGATIPVPTGVVYGTTLGAGTIHYSYLVTAVDAFGQESGPSAPVALPNLLDLRTTVGTNTIAWAAVVGAEAYNVYKTEVSVSSPVPAGSAYGFIGQVTGTSLGDSNIAPDYSIQPPIPQSPFANGSPVATATVTGAGSYTSNITVVFGASTNGRTAVGSAVSQVLSAAIAAGGTGYNIGDQPLFANGIRVQVTNAAAGVVTAIQLIDLGSTVTQIPANPSQVVANPPGASGLTVNFTWNLVGIQIVDAGSGYTAVPGITFTGAGITVAPTATATLDEANAGNPAVPTFFQQRLVLGVLPQEPQTIYMSRPGSFYNYDTHFPVQDDDAINATLVSGQVNNIKAMISQTSGLIILSDGLSWLINGGSAGAPITPAQIVANPQSFVGVNDMPPIVANADILYVQSKGTGVRDSSYNFYTNVFTSIDISVWSSHLFFGYELLEWAWAEEPFKLVWVVRSDGVMLTLTFLKEQEFVAWAHQETDGLYKSVCTVVEAAIEGYYNAVYTVVERTINGQTLKYIERFEERIFPNGVVDAWTVDAGLQYDGVPATSFTGGEHLAGETVTGLADGVKITPFVMPANGAFTLPSASKVTIGLPFTCRLQTLPLDLGEPSVQGKLKKVAAVVVRVADTLGLKIGSSFSRLVAMKDLVVGNVSSMLVGQDSQVVTDLVDGDAKTIVDPTWTTPGQYCIEQSDPYPASILGVFPEIVVGDTSK